MYGTFCNEAQNQHFCTPTTTSSRGSTYPFLARNGAIKWWKGRVKKLVMVYLCVMRCRYVDSNGVVRICGDCDLKGSQHYPVRFGLAITECFLEHYPMVKENVKKTRQALQQKPRPEAKDSLSVYRFIGLSVYRFICKESPEFISFTSSFIIIYHHLSVYRFIGLSVYRFIGLSVYRFIGLSV